MGEEPRVVIAEDSVSQPLFNSGDVRDSGGVVVDLPRLRVGHAEQRLEVDKVDDLFVGHVTVADTLRKVLAEDRLEEGGGREPRIETEPLDDLVEILTGHVANAAGMGEQVVDFRFGRGNTFRLMQQALK